MSEVVVMTECRSRRGVRAEVRVVTLTMTPLNPAWQILLQIVSDFKQQSQQQQMIFANISPTP